MHEIATNSTLQAERVAVALFAWPVAGGLLIGVCIAVLDVVVRMVGDRDARAGCLLLAKCTSSVKLIDDVDAANANAVQVRCRIEDADRGRR